MSFDSLCAVRVFGNGHDALIHEKMGNDTALFLIKQLKDAGIMVTPDSPASWREGEKPEAEELLDPRVISVFAAQDYYADLTGLQNFIDCLRARGGTVLNAPEKIMAPGDARQPSLSATPNAAADFVAKHVRGLAPYHRTQDLYRDAFYIKELGLDNRPGEPATELYMSSDRDDYIVLDKLKETLAEKLAQKALITQEARLLNNPEVRRLLSGSRAAAPHDISMEMRDYLLTQQQQAAPG